MTIDINELRRLAQAATSGEWYVERGNHIYGRNEVTDGEEVWHPVIACTDDDEVNVNFEANAAFIAAANPAAVSEMIDRLEATEKDRSNFIVEIGRLCAQCDALRAKIEAMEKQEPVAWLHESRRDSDVVTSAVKHVWGKAAVGSMAAYSIPLYLAPGAQPAPNDEYIGWYCAHCERGVDASEVTYNEQHTVCGRVITDDKPPKPTPIIPEGWKLVPIEPTETMISEGSCASSLPGPHYISEGCAQQCWKYMLAAAPEAKP